MKKFSITIALALLFMAGNGQSFSAFITYINTLPQPDRQEAVDSFMVVIAPSGFPYINADTATFIYLATAASVTVAGDFNGWDPEYNPLADVPGTTLWYHSRVFEMNARLDYKFVVNGSNWILDPLNPHQVSGGFGPNSELAMPGYVQPWEIEEIAGTPAGTIESFSITSTNTGSSFQVKVYLPVNYDPFREVPYPAAYFQDGYEYISLGSADIVLDNLINAGFVDTIIGVFVRPNNRNEEYAGNLRDEYRLFFVEELVPTIDEQYNTRQEAWGRAVCGDSFGGNISALIAYLHPEIFGNCGLHSGAFWPNNYEAYNLIVSGPVKNIRWASVWGSYESLYLNMRDFRDFLLGNGYELDWLELPEGHSWGLWRATIDELLPFFFPGENSGTGDYPVFFAGNPEITPNPFNHSATISFNLQKKSEVIFTLFSLNGQRIWSEQMGFLQKGPQKIELNLPDIGPGLYIGRLEAAGEARVVKMVRKQLK